MIFLIDECLHTSLVGVAQSRGYEAHHVVYLGMQGWKDPEVVERAHERDYTLITNNAADFSALIRKQRSPRRLDRNCSPGNSSPATTPVSSCDG